VEVSLIPAAAFHKNYYLLELGASLTGWSAHVVLPKTLYTKEIITLEQSGVALENEVNKQTKKVANLNNIL
jgi:hypothetical protein